MVMAELELQFPDTGLWPKGHSAFVLINENET